MSRTCRLSSPRWGRVTILVRWPMVMLGLQWHGARPFPAFVVDGTLVRTIIFTVKLEIPVLPDPLGKSSSSEREIFFGSPHEPVSFRLDLADSRPSELMVTYCR